MASNMELSCFPKLITGPFFWSSTVASISLAPALGQVGLRHVRLEVITDWNIFSNLICDSLLCSNSSFSASIRAIRNSAASCCPLSKPPAGNVLLTSCLTMSELAGLLPCHLASLLSSKYRAPLPAFRQDVTDLPVRKEMNEGILKSALMLEFTKQLVPGFSNRRHF